MKSKSVDFLVAVLITQFFRHLGTTKETSSNSLTGAETVTSDIDGSSTTKETSSNSLTDGETITADIDRSSTTTASVTEKQIFCPPIPAVFPYGVVQRSGSYSLTNSYAKGTVAQLECNNTNRGNQLTVCQSNGAWLPHPGVLCKPHMKETLFLIPYPQKNKRANGAVDVLFDFGKGNTANFGICARQCTNTPGCSAFGWSSDEKHCQLYKTFVWEMELIEAPGYKVAERSDVDELRFYKD